ncbi:MAG TPA: hypothetical protein VHV55_00095, partial [Pirellulales bacterium]|nr:hypothetical protein [Pirellulales bacterium]
LTNLRVLYLGHTAVTLKAVESLEKKLPNLRVLSYEPWQPVNGPFADFGQVIISGQQTVSGVLQPLVTAGKAGNIREVRIRGVKLAAGDVAQIVQLPALKRLGLHDIKLSTDRLEPLVGAAGLEELDLIESPLVSGDVAPISKLAKLRRLRLRCIQIEDAGVEHLRSLTELERLDLSGTQITDHALSIVSRFPRLEDLYLYDTKVAGDGLREVGKLAHLKKLGLPMGLFGTDFQHLRKLTSLEEIYLNQVVGTDEAVASLANCVKLKTLNLAFSDLSDVGMKTVAGFHALTYIMLARTKVTDNGLAALKQLSNLECIDASETSIGDDGLAHLKKLDKLNLLLLCRTRVTAAGLVHLRGLRSLRTLQVPYRCGDGVHTALLRKELPDLSLNFD